METRKAAPLHSYNQQKILGLARDFINADPADHISVADIGCFNRPVWGSVSKFKPSIDFLGVDEDPVAMEHLASVGLKGTDAAGYKAGPVHDYTFGLEVIEHIRSTDSEDFLATIRDKTAKAFFMTTPNFEGWDAKGPDAVGRRPEYDEMRYMPDHLRHFDPASPNPHRHKQIMTAGSLTAQFDNVLDPAIWRFAVIRAWPWRLEDLARGTVFEHYFKLHMVGWRPAAFDKDMGAILDAFCARRAVKAAVAT